MTDFLLTLEQLRAREGAKWRRHPPDVLPAFVADMDFAVAPPVRDAIKRLVERDDFGYGGMEDEQRVAGAFARRMYARYAWEVDSELVSWTADVVQGIVAAIVALTEPGDGIVVQTPIYPPFRRAIAGTDRRLMENPLVDDGTRFTVDAHGLRAAVDAGTKMIMLCNPHNPTGRVLTRAELEAIAGVALEHDIVIVSDEIHSELLFPGSHHIPIATLGPDVAARTVTLTSATKAFNIAGLRCAVAALGSPQMRDRFRRAIPEHLLGRPNRFGVEATIAAWAHGDEWLGRVLAYLEVNRRRVAEVVSNFAGVRYHEPEATYLAWLDCSRLELQAASPYDFFLEHARVALADGAEFGPPGRGCVRLNFATSADVLEQILDRMLEALRS